MYEKFNAVLYYSLSVRVCFQQKLASYNCNLVIVTVFCAYYTRRKYLSSVNDCIEDMPLFPSDCTMIQGLEHGEIIFHMHSMLMIQL